MIFNLKYMNVKDSSRRGESLSFLFSNMFLEAKTESCYSLSALSRGTMPVTFTNNEVKLKFLSNERYDFIEQYHNIKIGHGGKERTIKLIDGFSFINIS